jgi:hypothetical protein
MTGAINGAGDANSMGSFGVNHSETNLEINS